MVEQERTSGAVLENSGFTEVCGVRLPFPESLAEEDEHCKDFKSPQKHAGA
jgi:hypothetical protein